MPRATAIDVDTTAITTLFQKVDQTHEDSNADRYQRTE